MALGPARFRPKLAWLKHDRPWSWQRNPFVGTPAYGGLLVLMAVVNSTDLKNDNNSLYAFEEPRDGARRWYVVRDLGASLGETGWQDPRRNWIGGFERAGFIAGVENGHVRFDYHGRHKELLRQLTPADVLWTCAELERLTPSDWRTIFRAAGYSPELTARYVRRIRQKIAEGEALADR